MFLSPPVCFRGAKSNSDMRLIHFVCLKLYRHTESFKGCCVFWFLLLGDRGERGYKGEKGDRGDGGERIGKSGEFRRFDLRSREQSHASILFQGVFFVFFFKGCRPQLQTAAPV